MSNLLARQVAENLRSYRAERLLSQERLGQLLGKHRTYIGRIESGTENLSLANVERLAAQLGMHPTELLDGDLTRADRAEWVAEHGEPEDRPVEHRQHRQARQPLRAASDGRDPGRRPKKPT